MRAPSAPNGPNHLGFCVRQVQGIVTSANDGETVSLEPGQRSLVVSGVAYSGGGRGIASVEVSSDSSR